MTPKHTKSSKNCPKDFKNKILTLFNEVWEKGTLPKQFKHAIIVPIQKPGKDPKNPASNRPISLTPHLGKTLETIIKKRLNYLLKEQNKLITNPQAAFRRDRQTIDQVMLLENPLKTAEAKGKVVGAIFLDLEKAYDTQ